MMATRRSRRAQTETEQETREADASVGSRAAEDFNKQFNKTKEDFAEVYRHLLTEHGERAADSFVENLSAPMQKYLDDSLLDSMAKTDRSRMAWFNNPKRSSDDKSCQWGRSAIMLYAYLGPPFCKKAFLEELKRLALRAPKWDDAKRLLQEAVEDVQNAKADQGSKTGRVKLDGSIQLYQLKTAVNKLLSQEEAGLLPQEEAGTEDPPRPELGRGPDDPLSDPAISYDPDVASSPSHSSQTNTGISNRTLLQYDERASPMSRGSPENRAFSLDGSDDEFGIAAPFSPSDDTISTAPCQHERTTPMSRGSLGLSALHTRTAAPLSLSDDKISTTAPAQLKRASSLGIASPPRKLQRKQETDHASEDYGQPTGRSVTGDEQHVLRDHIHTTAINATRSIEVMDITNTKCGAFPTGHPEYTLLPMDKRLSSDVFVPILASFNPKPQSIYVASTYVFKLEAQTNKLKNHDSSHHDTIISGVHLLPLEHWCAVIVRTVHCTVEIFDPIGDKRNVLEAFRIVRSTMERVMPEILAWKLIDHQAPETFRQTDNTSCGVYAITYLLWRIHDEKVPHSCSHELWRVLLSSLFVNGTDAVSHLGNMVTKDMMVLGSNKTDTLEDIIAKALSLQKSIESIETTLTEALSAKKFMELVVRRREEIRAEADQLDNYISAFEKPPVKPPILLGNHHGRYIQHCRKVRNLLDVKVPELSVDIPTAFGRVLQCTAHVERRLEDLKLEANSQVKSMKSSADEQNRELAEKRKELEEDTRKIQTCQDSVNALFERLRR